MDHDQEKYYEAEELEVQSEAQMEGDHEDVNDMVYFIELLKHLRALIERGSKVPLTGKALIDVESCLMIIDSLDSNLPDAIQYGIQMYSERNRILGNAEDTAISRVTTAELKATKVLEKAREDAEQMVMDAEDEARAILDDANKEARDIIEDAQERADHMISESEILRQARDEARSIRNDARVEANETLLRANHEAFQMISEAEESLDKTLKEMRRLRSKVTGDGE